MARFKLVVVVAVAVAVAVLIFAWSRPLMSSGTPSHSVTLTWKPSPGATYYSVYRSDVSGSQYHKIGKAPSNTFTDSPVPSKAIYYYVVTAGSDRGESGYSNEIKVVVP